MKIPYTIVIGEKEIETNEVLPRVRKDLVISKNDKGFACKDLLKYVAEETASSVGGAAN